MIRPNVLVSYGESQTRKIHVCNPEEYVAIFNQINRENSSRAEEIQGRKQVISVATVASLIAVLISVLSLLVSVKVLTM